MTDYCVKSLCLMDFIYKYNNPDYQSFISSYGINQPRNDNFLKIKIVSNRVDSLKNDWVSDQTYEIDELLLNWKPDVFL